MYRSHIAVVRGVVQGLSSPFTYITLFLFLLVCIPNLVLSFLGLYRRWLFAISPTLSCATYSSSSQFVSLRSFETFRLVSLFLPSLSIRILDSPFETSEMTRLPTSASSAISSLLTIPPTSPLTFIYSSHSRWPLPPTASPNPVKSLKISVLDSSFNPPHAAHVALASLGSEDAQLLAFTLSNADKKVDKSELYHRLEMIRALAVDMGRKAESGKWKNCAVAVLDAPFFTQKSEVLNEQVTKLSRHHGEMELEPEFVFPVGEHFLLSSLISRNSPGIPRRLGYGHSYLRITLLPTSRTRPLLPDDHLLLDESILDPLRPTRKPLCFRRIRIPLLTRSRQMDQTRQT